MSVNDVMTRNIVTMRRNDPVSDAARIMRDADIGAIVVEIDDGSLYGILTDRDIVVRCIALDKDPLHTPVGDICSEAPLTITPEDSMDEAVRRMEENAVRRIPVVEGNRPVGIVSLRDLAIERDPDSALGQVSSAPPNR